MRGNEHNSSFVCEDIATLYLGITQESGGQLSASIFIDYLVAFVMQVCSLYLGAIKPVQRVANQVHNCSLLRLALWENPTYKYRVEYYYDNHCMHMYYGYIVQGIPPGSVSVLLHRSCGHWSLIGSSTSRLQTPQGLINGATVSIQGKLKDPSGSWTVGNASISEHPFRPTTSKVFYLWAYRFSSGCGTSFCKWCNPRAFWT